MRGFMDVNRRSFALFGASMLGATALSGRAWASAQALVRMLLMQESGACVRFTIALYKSASALTMYFDETDR
jgi:hypothetical protein